MRIVILAVVVAGCGGQDAPAPAVVDDNSPCVAERPYKKWSDGELLLAMAEADNSDQRLPYAKEVLCRYPEVST